MSIKVSTKRDEIVQSWLKAYRIIYTHTLDVRRSIRRINNSKAMGICEKGNRIDALDLLMLELKAK